MNDRVYSQAFSPSSVPLFNELLSLLERYVELHDNDCVEVDDASTLYDESRIAIQNTRDFLEERSKLVGPEIFTEFSQAIPPNGVLPCGLCNEFLELDHCYCGV